MIYESNERKWQLEAFNVYTANYIADSKRRLLIDLQFNSTKRSTIFIQFLDYQEKNLHNIFESYTIYSIQIS